jgi:hypothetical protein
MIIDETSVLPIAASRGHSARSEVVVRIHQPGIRGDDAVPIGVGVVAGEHVVVAALGDEGCHRARRRGIHADLLVPVEGHEAPRRVDLGIHDGQVDAVHVLDQLPVLDRRAAHRIRADAHARALDRVEVDDRGQVAHVRVAEVVLADRIVVDVGVRDALDTLQAGLDQRVGALGDPPGRVGVGRAAVRRVVLEASVAGRVVTRGDDDAIGAVGVIEHAAAVVGEDGVTERGGGHPRVARVDAHVDAVADQHFDRGALGRQRQRMCVAAEEQRAPDALLAAIVDDGLRGGHDVLLVEARRERRAAVAAGAERHALRRDRRVGDAVVIGGDQLVDVDEVVLLRGEASSARHGDSLPSSGRLRTSGLHG